MESYNTKHIFLNSVIWCLNIIYDTSSDFDDDNDFRYKQFIRISNARHIWNSVYCDKHCTSTSPQSYIRWGVGRVDIGIDCVSDMSTPPLETYISID